MQALVSFWSGALAAAERGYVMVPMLKDLGLRRLLRV